MTAGFILIRLSSFGFLPAAEGPLLLPCEVLRHPRRAGSDPDGNSAAGCKSENERARAQVNAEILGRSGALALRSQARVAVQPVGGIGRRDRDF